MKRAAIVAGIAALAVFLTLRFGSKLPIIGGSL